VFTNVADPVGLGFVTSLARPGGNVTGVSSQNPEVAAKSLALLKEAVPTARRIAILTNPTNTSLTLVLSETQAAAKALRLEIGVVKAKASAEFEGAFAGIVRDRAAGLVILADALFTSEARRLATLAAQHRLPTMGGHESVPEGGGLMSYGANRQDLVRRAAILLDKILKGAKPANLPVEQPTKFELIINKKTAKELGIKTVFAEVQPGQKAEKVKRILELNPNHPLIPKLQALFVENRDDPRLAAYARLLLGQAYLAESGQLPDPTAFTTALGEVMLRAV